MHHKQRVKGVYSIPRIWRGPDADAPESMVRHKQRVKGVYSIPRIWRGPDGDVPESIKLHGIDPRRLNIDPDKLVRFEIIPRIAPMSEDPVERGC